MLYRLSLVSALIWGLSTQAQNHVDALRFSQESLWGSARYVAMGGAFGSLGANGSTSSSNPAGIATFTTGQFSGSLNFNELTIDGFDSQSSFNSPNSFAKKSSASIPNINYISANMLSPEISGDWDRINFGLGYNKLEDYNKSIYIWGEGSNSSLSNYILESAQGNTYEQLNTLGQLAFATYLIDTMGGDTNYNSSVGGILDRTQTYKSITSGGKNEFYISFGSAYQNKLFLGATIGFPNLNYNEVTTISEGEFDSNGGLESFDYTSNLSIEGSGINLKLGLIYKLDEAIRYGFALHTPTYYEIHEEYSSSMNTTFLNDTLYSADSYLNLFDYGLNSPFKIINSISFVIKKKAIISLEHEYLDYSTANLTSEFYSFSSENDDINKYFASTSNVKIGAEIRIHPQLSLRTGYAHYGSPLTDSSKDSSKEYLTCGLGVRVNQYFFDLAMVKSYSQSYLNIYPNSEPAKLNKHTGQLLISGGFKF